jgi:hypothetical protein
MPLVVANDQHPDEVGLDIVEEMVREAFEVGPPEATVRWT